MNRHERRRHKRSSNDEAMMNMYLNMSDPCIVATLDDAGLNIDQITEILKANNDYLQDYTKYIEREGGLGMVENEKVLNEVKTKIGQYMRGKMDKAKALKLLRNEFNLPMAVISDLWIECKVNKIKPKNRPDMGHSLKGMKYDNDFDDEYQSEIASINNEIFDEVMVTMVDSADEEIAASKVKEECEKLAANLILDKVSGSSHHLEIINKTVEIRGEYGVYVKNNMGVKYDSVLYSDKNMIIKEKETSILVYNEKIVDVKKQIEALKTQLKGLETENSNNIAYYNELESVFDLKI